MGDMNKLKLKLEELLRECDKHLEVPENHKRCKNCRWINRRSSCLIECVYVGELVFPDSTCDNFRISLDYIQRKLGKEVIHK